MVVINVCAGVFVCLLIATIVALVRRVQAKEKRKHGEVVTFGDSITALRYALLAIWQQLRSNNRGAIESYNISIAHNPNNMRAHFSRGLIFTKLKRNEEALADFSTALEAIPDHYLALLNRGGIYVRLDDFANAISDLNDAIALKPNKLDAYLYRIFAYLGLAQYEDALADVNFFIRRVPKKHIGYTLRGAIYLQKRKYDAAIRDLQRAYEFNSSDSLTLYYFANYDLKTQHPESALERCQTYIEKHPKPEPNWYLLRAEAYRRLKQFDDALRDSDKFVSLTPDISIGYNNRAWLKAAMDDYDRALVDANKAIELDSEKPIYYSTRGTVKWLLNDKEAALSDFDIAHEMDKSHAASIASRAVALHSLERTDEAIAVWQQIQAREDDLTTAKALQDEYGYAQPFYEAMLQVEALAKGK